MKKIFVATALSIASMSMAYAADSGVYASVKAGISDTKYKDSSDLLVDSNQLINNSNANKSVYPTVSAAVGYDFSTISPVNARAELEYTYKNSTTFSPDANLQTDLSTGSTSQPFSNKEFNNELTTQSLMLNAYYDFKNQSKFTPYLSAGAGLTHVKNKQNYVNNINSSNSDSDNHFTWSAGAGVAYAVSQNVALDLSYRYVDAGKFKFDNVVNGDAIKTNAKLTSNEYLLGVRYNF